MRGARVVPYGPTACLVEVEDAPAATALARWVRALGLPGVEVVPGARTVLLDGLGAQAALAVLPAEVPGPPLEELGTVEVPVRLDGPDLGHVASLWGCPPAEVGRRLLATTFTSAFAGFAPGFSYLHGLPRAWAVPRHPAPRTRVPAGSVALAGTWCGIYPTSSPGGWQLVATTDAVLWDLDRDPPALLAPGVRVRFVEA